VVIVCIGDSITYGQRLDPQQAWPQLLQIKEVIPAGVPGDTTRLGLERFPKDVQNVGPVVVVIQFGHNDCNRWQTDRGLPRVSPRSFQANLIEMIDRSRTFDIQPVLCSLTPSYRSEEHARDVTRYDQIIRRTADDETVPLADVRAAGEWAMLTLDGLHLTAEGHRLYAAAVEATLHRYELA
jgi:lysophospholipase L1-like esterase